MDEANKLMNNQINKLKDNKSNESKALYLIQSRMEETTFPKVYLAKNSKTAWEILQRNYQGLTKEKIVKSRTLRIDFESIEMKGLN